MFNFPDRFSFHKTQSSGSLVFPCGQTETKLIVAFRIFANAPKVLHICYLQPNSCSDPLLAFNKNYTADLFNKIQQLLSLIYWIAFYYFHYIQQNYVCVYFDYYAKDTTDAAVVKQKFCPQFVRIYQQFNPENGAVPSTDINMSLRSAS